MIQETGETIVHVKFHDSTAGDEFAADWPTAIALAVENMATETPTIYKMTVGSMLVLTSDQDEKVTLREFDVKVGR